MSVERLLAKHDTFDLFQNVCCVPISESKMACNSNVSFLFPGPYLFYTTKYHQKKTQKEDQAEFEAVKQTTQKMLSEGSKHEHPRSEAIRRILCASFAHNSDNVIGCPMAARLKRTKTRFYFSHSFVDANLAQMVDALHGNDFQVKIRFFGRMRIIEKQSFDYLC